MYNLTRFSCPCNIDKAHNLLITMIDTFNYIGKL